MCQGGLWACADHECVWLCRSSCPAPVSATPCQSRVAWISKNDKKSYMENWENHTAGGKQHDHSLSWIPGTGYLWPWGEAILHCVALHPLSSPAKAK